MFLEQQQLRRVLLPPPSRPRTRSLGSLRLHIRHARQRNVPSRCRVLGRRSGDRPPRHGDRCTARRRAAAISPASAGLPRLRSGHRRRCQLHALLDAGAREQGGGRHDVGVAKVIVSVEGVHAGEQLRAHRMRAVEAMRAWRGGRLVLGRGGGRLMLGDRSGRRCRRCWRMLWVGCSGVVARRWARHCRTDRPGGDAACMQRAGAPRKLRVGGDERHGRRRELHVGGHAKVRIRRRVVLHGIALAFVVDVLCEAQGRPGECSSRKPDGAQRTMRIPMTRAQMAHMR
jgi:hypothetical protein